MGTVSAIPIGSDYGTIDFKSQTMLSFGKPDIIFPWNTWDYQTKRYELDLNQKVRFILDKSSRGQIATIVRPLSLYPGAYMVVVEAVSLRKSPKKKDYYVENYKKKDLLQYEQVRITKIKGHWGQLKNGLWAPLIVDDAYVILEPMVVEDAVIDGLEALSEPNWSALNLPIIEKKFYEEHSAVSRRLGSVINKWRKKNDIRIFNGDTFLEKNSKPLGDDKFRPVVDFKEANLPDGLIDRFNTAGFQKPTPIQAQSWPIIMSGHDMIGVADTGSGKTLAFLVPAIVHMQVQQELASGDGPIALILAPTRELAIQIQVEAEKFFQEFTTTVVYGGADKSYQLDALYYGSSIVVATPGRLIDFLCGGDIKMNRVTYLVFDEADRMLDMGFEPQIRAICSQIRPNRQSLMFSATWPKAVTKIARDFLVNPIAVNVGSVGLSSNSMVKQIIKVVPQREKMTKFLYTIKEIFAMKPNSKALIFCNTKRMTRDLPNKLWRSSLTALCIHGDMDQYQREEALDSFRNGSTNILAATDVCARGIDICDITHVINVDFPTNCEDYVHRIGRTGRAGRSGIAITFFTESDRRRAWDLINVLEEAKQKVPPALRRCVKSRW